MKKWRSNLFRYGQDIIEGKRKGVSAKFLNAIAYVLSLFWQSFVFLKNLIYDFKFLKPKKVNATVISIGNIVAGGTKKTPTILFLAETLLQKKKKVCILSRGYLSNAENQNIFVEREKSFFWEDIGDEPCLIMKRLKDVFMVVGKNRVLSARKAIKKGSEIILLDDGLQYRKLHRDFEIVTMNSRDLFGKGYFLPRGYLRDSPKRLKAADLILIQDIEDEFHFDLAKKSLAPFTSAPAIGMTIEVKNIKNLEGQEKSSLENILVGVFCGIAHPESLNDTVKELKAKIVHTLFEVDHAVISKEALKKFSDECLKRGAKFLVCSEKDAVKLEGMQASLSLPILLIEIELKIITEKNKWEMFVEEIVRK